MEINYLKYLKYIIPIFISSCALDPSGTNDYTNLGKSELAEKIKPALFLGESATNQWISNWVNNSNILIQPDPYKEMEKLGFNCKSKYDQTCTYDGSAKSTITSTDRKNIERFETSIHIDAILENTSIKVKSKISKFNY
ncbi:hypothetical protein HH212_26935 (plasmid) [Massilia forsythiae]|uniref:Lipoprotein n=1 Tax=Massilia forsythiae TaxID=2728020 RepID=A0A7Z2W2V4_9BURK|nr:hypothetical protein [Massilia forsythiae]QJE03735.1 hypothetical protein HH212_26935 [Massilia forsythiae]